MTIDHMRAMWGYELTLPPTAALDDKQPALRMGRRFPAYNLTTKPSYAVEDDPWVHENMIIRPYCFPCPAGFVDSLGVGFRSGSLCVVTACATDDPLASDYNSSFEAFWPKLLEDPFQPIYVVPSQLPDGYTPSRQVIWRSSPQPLGYYFTKDSWQIPENGPLPAWDLETFEISSSGTVGWVGTRSSSSAGSPFTGPDVYWSYSSGFAGYRKVQYRLRSLSDYTVLSGSFYIVFSHNADGSTVGSGDGDTTDYSGTISSGDFTGSGGTFTTSWVDIGSLYLPAGLNADLSIKLGSSAGFTWSGTGFGSINAYIDLRLSESDYIPFPHTILGQGNLIAPGGIIA